MIEDKSFKLAASAFLTALVLIGLGMLIYFNTSRTGGNDPLAQNNDHYKILKQVVDDVNNTYLGHDEDSFGEIDQELQKLSK